MFQGLLPNIFSFTLVFSSQAAVPWCTVWLTLQRHILRPIQCKQTTGQFSPAAFMCAQCRARVNKQLKSAHMKTAHRKNPTHKLHWYLADPGKARGFSGEGSASAACTVVLLGHYNSHHARVSRHYCQLCAPANATMIRHVQKTFHAIICQLCWSVFITNVIK